MTQPLYPLEQPLPIAEPSREVWPDMIFWGTIASARGLHYQLRRRSEMNAEEELARIVDEVLPFDRPHDCGTVRRQARRAAREFASWLVNDVADEIYAESRYENVQDAVDRLRALAREISKGGRE